MLCLQCEFLNVNANELLGKTTLYTGGRYVVSHQCEFLNVSATVENFQRFLYRGSTEMLCLQYELLNVSANEMNGKTTLDTDGRNRVSHQCELSYEFSEFLTWQMILCIWCS